LDQKKKTNKEEEGTKVSDGREERAPPEATRGGGEGVEVWGSVNRVRSLYQKDFFVNNEGVMRLPGLRTDHDHFLMIQALLCVYR